jgi:hypothetical protein
MKELTARNYNKINFDHIGKNSNFIVGVCEYLTDTNNQNIKLNVRSNNYQP